ncbi:replication-associated recombination protein A [Inconstantimicrobium porci]|uniref:replication-associated recombination protein A n=1 Tax=Inconstantimicrobium porci TaxID=2652291 RepID=UPI0024097639|nr:replication-associated recombination protein A [Inconstantimicrobium porci]MDD6770259.1 replication-associated recombination protein A [Inconstantimicrobium porci]
MHGVKNEPLASRVRPRNFDEYVGQQHILGKGKMLRHLIDSDTIPSMIFWGPPGVGKTTLAMIIASHTKSEFKMFSAVNTGVKDIKEIIETAKNRKLMGIRTIVFMDEIHRFNKSQQDAFLPAVESGDIILIGATTENPSFEVNSALLSRSRVFVLQPLDNSEIVNVMKNALKDERGFSGINVTVDDKSLEIISVYCNGDARTALNILEMAVNISLHSNKAFVTKHIIEQCVSKKSIMYDKDGEEHYNLISALHKSMRNSDPDASVYWLCRMLESGEDPLYVARRIIRFASEDVGMADPRALEIAINAYNAAHFIGMPECNVNLTQAVVYMALAPKSNALYAAYEMAKKDVKENRCEGVPLQLRNDVTNMMRNLGYGKGYKYAHDYNQKVTSMQCLPDNLKDRVYYNPTEQGLEKKYGERLKYIKDLKKHL